MYHLPRKWILYIQGIAGKKPLRDVYGYTSDAVHEEAKSVTGDLSKALEKSASSQQRS